MFGSEFIEQSVLSASAKGTAIIPFITAGYPEKNEFSNLVLSLSEVADVIEIGVPFSDPMADGVTIQRSSRQAIESGVRLQWILEQLQAIEVKKPVILMSYLNPLFVFGYEALVRQSLEAGVDGFIVPDLPIEEGSDFRHALNEANLGLIQLVTPASPAERIAKVAAMSSGFLYAVTVKGVTGGADGLPDTVTGYLEQVQELATIPVCAGFGVRTAEDVALLEPYVDGIIVGSALLEAIESGQQPAEFLTGLRAQKR